MLSHRLWLVVKLLLLQWLNKCLTKVEALQPLHIAVLYDPYATDVYVKYLEKTLNASLGSRSLLPDYEVFVHVLYYEPGTAAVKLMEALNDKERKYAAIVGPIDNADVEEVVDLSPAARILHVHESDAPHLSDRTRYPYNFRGWRSLEGQIAIWFHIVATNAWDHVLGIWFSEGEIVASASFAEMYNISYTASIATNQHQPVYGDEWMRSAVQVLRRERMRVVMLFMTVWSGRMFTCYVHTSPISGLQYFVPGYYSPGWWVGDDIPCDSESNWVAVRGHIAAVHTPFAPGVSLFGLLEVRALEGDNTTQNLTCSPGVTVNDFFNNGELLVWGLSVGQIRPDNLVADATAFFGVAGVRYEDACATLIGLHRTIYGRNITLEQLENREPEAFQVATEEMKSVEFQGPSGPFRYYEGTGDPVYVMFLVAQYALPHRGNTSIELNGFVTFPSGPRGDPEYLWNEGGELMWRDDSLGLSPKPHLARFPDCSLENAELWFDSCRPCAEGLFFDTYFQECRTCVSGTFSNTTGRSACDIANLGHYINDTLDPRMEAPCPPGTGCPQPGLVQPVRCVPGTFASGYGSSGCSFCPQGSYQAEAQATACVSCEASGTLIGGTTRVAQATSASECVCPEGSYLPLNSTVCQSCPGGMTCEKGSDMRNMQNYLAGESDASSVIPTATPGHMTLRKEAFRLIVYKCDDDDQCPGGGPGSCADYRDATAVACGVCEEGAYEIGAVCKPCGDETAWPFILTAIGALFAVIIATILVNRDVHKTPAATLMIVVVTGLLFSSMQALGIFSQVEIPWVEPMTSILRLVSVFSFDLKLLKMQCVVGVNHVRAFAVRQLVAVGAVPFIWLTLCGKKYAPRYGRPQTRIWVELSNAIGTLYSVFFISIVISAMDPFICYKHPTDGLESVRSAPSILCFEGGDHTEMVTIGLIALFLVPFPYLALCTYGILRYPYAVNARDSSGFLAAMRFLFFRYTPSRYYFQIFVLLRSLLLCLVPVVFRNNSSTQVIFLAVILSVYVLAQEELKPWRAKMCNGIDAAMSLMLVVLLLCGALFIPDTPGKTVVAIMSTSIMVTLFLAFIIAVGVGVQRRLLPRPYYHYFICHHKAHAAAQARFLKILLLQKRSSINVFIDSDDLQELDRLFDVVKARVGCLAVYLTSHTLRRPWCAGEIVTAFRVKISVVALKTPSFVAPSTAQLNSIDSYLDRFGCNLSEYNIQFADVAKAFQLLLGDIPNVVLSRSRVSGSRKFDTAASELLAAKGAFRMALFSPTTTTERIQPLSEVSGGGLLVSTDVSSDEANASGAILISLISQDVIRVCEAGAILLADHPFDIDAMLHASRMSRVVVIMLSEHSMNSVEQLVLICNVMNMQDKQHRAPGVISMNTAGFEFPDEAYFEATLPAVIASTNLELDAAKNLIRLFFKRISMVWPTHASQQALLSQAQTMFKRASPFLRVTSTKLTSNLLGSDASVASNKLDKLHNGSGNVAAANYHGSSGSAPSSTTPDGGHAVTKKSSLKEKAPGVKPTVGAGGEAVTWEAFV